MAANDSLILPSRCRHRADCIVCNGQSLAHHGMDGCLHDDRGVVPRQREPLRTRALLFHGAIFSRDGSYHASLWRGRFAAWPAWLERNCFGAARRRNCARLSAGTVLWEIPGVTVISALTRADNQQDDGHSRRSALADRNDGSGAGVPLWRSDEAQPCNR